MSCRFFVMGLLCSALCTPLAAQDGASPVVLMVPKAEQPGSGWAQQQEQRDDPAGDLDLAFRSFMNVLGYPNPAFRGAPALSERPVLVFISRTGDVLRFEGDQVSTGLLTVFAPEQGGFRFAAPDVSVRGNFGLATRRFSVEEPGKRKECMVIHAEAWRSTRGWKFHHITLASMPYLDPCDIAEG